MKIKYFSDDGKVFEDKEQCLAYETKVEQEKKRQEEIKREKEARYEEVVESMKRATELYKKFEKDYPQDKIYRNPEMNILKDFPILYSPILKDLFNI